MIGHVWSLRAAVHLLFLQEMGQSTLGLSKNRTGKPKERYT